MYALRRLKNEILHWFNGVLAHSHFFNIRYIELYFNFDFNSISTLASSVYTLIQHLYTQITIAINSLISENAKHFHPVSVPTTFVSVNLIKRCLTGQSSVDTESAMNMPDILKWLIYALNTQHECMCYTCV